MKLDDEMRAALAKAIHEVNGIPESVELLHEALQASLLTGYRLALERAAKVAHDYIEPPDKRAEVFVLMADSVAAAIRALGSEHE